MWGTSGRCARIPRVLHVPRMLATAGIAVGGPRTWSTGSARGAAPRSKPTFPKQNAVVESMPMAASSESQPRMVMYQVGMLRV